MPSAQILIVEDERIVARDLSIRLRRLGHTVTGIVPSGAAAIAQVTINRPQPIFMDIILEGPLDGIETAERILALYAVPIIYVTAHADAATRQRAWQTGTPKTRQQAGVAPLQSLFCRQTTNRPKPVQRARGAHWLPNEAAPRPKQQTASEVFVQSAGSSQASEGPGQVAALAMHVAPTPPAVLMQQDCVAAEHLPQFSREVTA